MADKPSDGKRIDDPTGTELVGHEWDGIEELNTPLPRWWLWTFYLTIIWSAVYVVLYPAWPLIEKGTEGVLGWSSRGDLIDEMGAADAARQTFREQLAAIDVDKLRDNPDLLQQALAGGQAAFKVNCTQCHGSGAAGNQKLGYPNLNDDDWIWGGDLDAIHYTIAHGIRQDEDNGLRQGVMPAFDGAFDAAQLDAVTDHVLSLSKKAQSNAIGAQLYADNCVACHGASGEGDRAQGAPRLDDAIWLRGGSRAEIKAQILNPKMGAMPGWEERLDPATVKMLTAYVHSLGGGEQTVANTADDPVTEPEVDGDEQP
ncbi:cytochrome-c oxidase, cbb3-type subunit III [Parerythrobacter jejuensis]|uniref:Cbb3-type cytochrome c oxidase subunit n=2 Tax=Parerythrobacter jejuensis TaxID=795812 RepID=A0A845AIV6_9SPHN|nr:cytochrome-c oxidase, cbb3-type subunit III [Parerythrobacter jejuensis]MXP30632.1 cytochrome-c oxidase, cbb3-type subunit III [Parerythrobacter jejuensis]MXP33392.1 cytochrome-c oxidase, cbb3-type subunit III [Parerythrobacter jejuensis]